MRVRWCRAEFNFASDDCACPSLCSLPLDAVWLAGVAVAYSVMRNEDCGGDAEGFVDAAIITMLVVMSLAIAMNFIATIAAWHGRPAREGCRPMAMKAILYGKTLQTMTQFAACIFLLYVIDSHLDACDRVLTSSEESYVEAFSSVLAIFGLVQSIMTACIMSCCMAGCRKRLKRRCGCCVSASPSEAYDYVVKLLKNETHLVRPAFSDFFLGLVLVREEQHEQRVEMRRMNTGVQHEVPHKGRVRYHLGTVTPGNEGMSCLACEAIAAPRLMVTSPAIAL